MCVSPLNFIRSKRSKKKFFLKKNCCFFKKSGGGCNVAATLVNNIKLSRAMSLGSLQVLNFSKDKVMAIPRQLCFINPST